MTAMIETASMTTPTQLPVSRGNSDHARMGRVLELLADRFPGQPSLGELAASVGLGEHHFQRMFLRWVGVSPKKFLQHVTLEAAKRRLRDSASVLDAAYDSGLSGPGRLHDLFINFEAMTPGEYKARGDGLTVRYGFHDSPFGECLLMATERGICGLRFLAGESRETALARHSRGWERAELIRDDTATAAFVPRIFTMPGQPVARGTPPLRLLLRGSRFQLKVWQALLSIPPAGLASYQDIARLAGLNPGAARAVGSANGANPIPWLIPCHRVIRKSGALGGYTGGLGRKLAMIGWEAALQDS
jgi:AraC family transcriptional regulator of adaptative response/methylated-DNA-[protein]-cysteine methyltransferase